MDIPTYLQAYRDLIFLVKPYRLYIQAGLILLMGYLIVNSTSNIVYIYMNNIADHNTAATMKTITKVSGTAVLLSVLSTIFNVNPAAALTVGSFGGLVVGFATQRILSNVVAGVFLLLSRPFTYGDVITVLGQKGIVKEIRLMHLVIESEDKQKKILIPSGSVVTEIIEKVKTEDSIPFDTEILLNNPPATIEIGSKIRLSGVLRNKDLQKPISNMNVKLFDSDIGRDDLLSSAVTDKEGRFNIVWEAYRQDFDGNEIEIYTKFDRTEKYKQCKSKLHTIEIK
jgi:small-conductance mechanosensitive channel